MSSAMDDRNLNFGRLSSEQDNGSENIFAEEENKWRLSMDSHGWFDVAKRWLFRNKKNIAICSLILVIVILLGLNLDQMATIRASLGLQRDKAGIISNQTENVKGEVQEMQKILENLKVALKQIERSQNRSLDNNLAKQQDLIEETLKNQSESSDSNWSNLKMTIQNLTSQLLENRDLIQGSSVNLTQILVEIQKQTDQNYTPRDMTCLARMNSFEHLHEITRHMKLRAFKQRIYLFVKLKRNHDFADESCRDKGLDLVSISNQDQNNFLTSQEGNWYWTSGKRDLMNDSSSTNETSTWKWGEDGDNWEVESEDSCQTVDSNKTCTFPFQYKDKEYNGCTSIDHHQLWCATDNIPSTENSGWGFTGWGECGDCDDIYRNWGSEEPNNHLGKEDCLNFEVSTGKWNDENCSTRGYYICEAPC